MVNSPNFPPTQPPKSAPRQIAASGVPVVTSRKPPVLSPIPVISAKPGTAPTTATVSIKKTGPPTTTAVNTVPIVSSTTTATMVPGTVPILQGVRPQVKLPSQLQMPVISKGEKSQTSNTLSVETASDLDTNVFLNE